MDDTPENRRKMMSAIDLLVRQGRVELILKDGKPGVRLISRKAPQITNCVVERIEENQRSGCEMGVSEQVGKCDVL